VKNNEINKIGSTNPNCCIDAGSGFLAKSIPVFVSAIINNITPVQK
jgi:hypothetical protein